MKIALVILHAYPARGGAERYTADLARALQARGEAVTIVCAEPAPKPPDVPVIDLNVRGLTRSRRYEAFLDLLDEHLRRAKYDLVHAMLPVRQCDLYHPHAGIAAEQLKKWTTLVNPRRQMMAAVEYELLHRNPPPTVLVLSDYLKRFVTRHYPKLPADRMMRLFNGIDLHRFDIATTSRAATTDVRPSVGLIIAQDFERKGLKQTIEAAGRIGKDRLSLVVLGGDDAKPYLSQARVCNAAVEFVGVADPRPHYAAADFFVLPTRHDPCSLVVLEALAMGVPVISTKFNGACEIMQDGVHGFVLDDPDNIDALTAAMTNMLDPARRARMRDACLTLRPELSQDRHVDRLMDVYRTTFASRATGHTSTPHL